MIHRSAQPSFLAASAVAAALLAAAPSAARAAASPATASADDVRALQQQLQQLADRLDRLERDNRELRAENSALRGQAGAASGAGGAAVATAGGSPAPAAGAATAAAPSDALTQRVDTLQASLDKTTADLAKTRANAPEWAGRFTFRGDLRYRHEQIESGDNVRVPPPGQPAIGELDRVRDRIRLRFGGTFRLNDTMSVAMRIATGGEDPRSPNATLGDTWSRKAFNLDQAFFSWQPTEAWLVRGGKMPMPWTRPSWDLFWDNDLNPEGLAVNYSKGPWFANASYMWIQERGPAITVAGEGAKDLSDPAMGHVQAGLRYPLGEGSALTAALGYYDHFAVQGRRPWFGLAPNGNSTVDVSFPAGSTTRIAVSRYDYDILHAIAQYERPVLGGLPLTAFAQYARNADAEFDTAWATGVMLGRAGKPRTWEVGALYQTIEKDALFGQWVDSNFGAGLTDSRGWVLRAIYAPATNMTLNATYFLNDLHLDGSSPTQPRDRDYRRLQLDANFRF
jgi:hypothetical protein